MLTCAYMKVVELFVCAVAPLHHPSPYSHPNILVRGLRAQ